MFPLKRKKKRYRLARLGELSSPGRATPVRKYKGVEGECFPHPKLFPLTSKTPKLTGITRTAAPKLPLLSFCFSFHVLILSSQVSAISLGYLALH